MIRWLGRAGYNPASGTLVATAGDLRALVTGPPPQHGRLVEVGAVRHGLIDERLAITVEALRCPVGGVLQLSYKGRALDGWRGRHAAALLMPADQDGLHTLAQVPDEHLPVALAKVADLADRPRAAAPTDTAALRLAPDLIRWWRLLIGPTPESGGGLLEVVDTRHGLYLVLDDSRAIPTDAAAVRQLMRWLLDHRPATQPLRPLPDGVALPEPAPTLKPDQHPNHRHPANPPHRPANTRRPDIVTADPFSPHT